MEDTVDPTKLIDLPSQLLDTVVKVLAKVGIELPALVLQLFLLVLTLIALLVAVRRLLPDWRNPKPLPLLSTGAIALVPVGIVCGIVSQTLLPDSLVGQIVGQELHGAKVELCDFRGQAVSTGGSVDTQSGEFVAYYSPAWNGRAHTLRITSAICKSQEHAIARGRLARGAKNIWDFQCEQP